MTTTTIEPIFSKDLSLTCDFGKDRYDGDVVMEEMYVHVDGENIDIGEYLPPSVVDRIISGLSKTL